VAIGYRRWPFPSDNPRGTLTDGNDNRFAILCVCTGNVCRSPAAERLLAARLGPGVVVASAGTVAALGGPGSARSPLRNLDGLRPVDADA
jgi:hypothetical protein